jgi:hypothetical protein
VRRPATALILITLTALFGARVIGQALVAFFGVTWLPPMEAWYSGLLPYPILLPLQVLILVAQSVIDHDVWRGRGFFARPRPRGGRRLQWLAAAYAAAMLIRLAVTGSHPIPIAFHWVLAAYLFTLGGMQRRGGASIGAAPAAAEKMSEAMVAAAAGAPPRAK